MFNKILEEIFKELDIKYTYLSKDWIIKLEKDNKVKYIAGYKFDLNGHGIGNVMDDKYALYDTLKSFNIPVCLHSIFYKEDNKNDYAINCNTKKDLLKCFNKYNRDVIIKPNMGTIGAGVSHITTEEDLYRESDKLFIDNFSISMSPYYHIKNEYRVIVLDNEVKLLFKKINPVVIGDGHSTLSELLTKFNSYYFTDKEVDDIILNDGEIYTYDFRFNLSRGSIASIDIDSKTYDKVAKLAVDTSQKAGIRFASIDIIICEDDSMLVLEANSGVTINKVINFIPNGYEIAKNIYKEAILKMFEE